MPLVAAHVDANYAQKTPPAYPALSRRLHEEGKVELLVRVSAKGNVDAIEVKKSSGYSRLDEVALNTVRAWRFVPARRGEEAVADSVVVPIQFKLND
jgi:protein TonB